MWTPPLEIFIAWDQRSEVAPTLAKALYAAFCGDPDVPIAMGPEIPVFYRSTNADKHPAPIDIPWGRAHHEALILLADDAMVAERKIWQPWIERASEFVAEHEDKRRIFLVGLSEHFANLDPDLAGRQATRLVQLTEDPESLETELVARIANELCRILDPARDDETTTALFLSHAKADGLNAAESVKDYIDRSPVGKSLFDAVTLQPAKEYDKEFHKQISAATLVVLMTDKWSTRYWCQWEASLARELDRPIILVDLLVKEERNHGRHLSDVPVIRCQFGPTSARDKCSPDGLSWRECRRIVAAAQRETLRDLHARLRMESLAVAGLLPGNSYHLGRAPDVATIVTVEHRLECQAREQGNKVPAEMPTFVYPDPPLADYERRLIARLKSNPNVSTPTELIGRVQGNESPLLGKTIAVSISDPPDMQGAGFGHEHLDRLWVSLSRHLLSSGAGVAYGGDLRERGYTEILFDLVRAYADENRALAEDRVHWHVGWPIHTKMTLKDRAGLAGVITMHCLPKPDDVPLDEETFVPPAHAQYAWICSMSEMRRHMVEESSARVIVGGQRLASTPRSGIAEELTLSLRAGQPVYLCGGFGGMTADLIKAIRGETPESLTDKYQITDPGRQGAVDEFNASQFGSKDPIDYAALVKELHEAGIAGLQNGLGEDLNERLFVSQSTEEIVGLIRRGLSCLFRG